MAKVCDLHTHSYYSDGRISVKELLKEASKKGIEYLALTDHNSIAGVEEAISGGKRLGIVVIPGIELRAREGEVLGYFVDLKDNGLNKEVAEIRRRVENKIMRFCEELARKKYDISFNEIQEKFPKAKGNINEFYPYYALLLKGYGRDFTEIRNKLRADGIKRRKIYEIPITRAIRTIKCAGGIPVLAHPWAEEKSKELLKEKNLEKLIKAGLKGIEIDNGDRDGRRTREIVMRIRYLSKKYDLILTSGSDYHGGGLGSISETHALGTHNCDEQVVKMLSEART